MESFFTDLVIRIGEAPVVWAYGLLFLAAYLENVCPPVPGDVCVVFAGYLASEGTLHLPLVIVLGTASGILGFMTVFYAGRTVGHRLVASRRFRWISQDALDKTERWVARWGAGVVLMNRFLAAVRSVVALSVGMGSMKSRHAALLCSVAALLWTALLSLAGYTLGANWERIWDFLATYSRIVLAAVVLGAGVAVWRSIRRKQTAD